MSTPTTDNYNSEYNAGCRSYDLAITLAYVYHKKLRVAYTRAGQNTGLDD